MSDDPFAHEPRYCGYCTERLESEEELEASLCAYCISHARGMTDPSDPDAIACVLKREQGRAPADVAAYGKICLWGAVAILGTLLLAAFGCIPG